MGYTSKVAIALHKTVLAENLITSTPLPELLRKSAYTDLPQGRFWLFNSIKWYEGYPDMDEVTEYLLGLECEGRDTFDDHRFAFVRIGEDDRDIVTKGAPWVFDIQLVRDIQIPTLDPEPEGATP